MLTADDIRSIPLFSTLPEPELERLAASSADLHLGAGRCARADLPGRSQGVLRRRGSPAYSRAATCA